MRLCSVGHILKNKSDIKGSIIFPWFLNATSSFHIKKVSSRSLTDSCHFFLIESCLFFPFFEDITNPPSTLSLVFNFLTPCLPLSIHALSFSLVILTFGLYSYFFSFWQLLAPILIPGKCRSFPDKFLMKQSLWRSSAELCQKMCGNSLDGKEKGLLIVFSFFFSSSGFSHWGEKKFGIVPLFILQRIKFLTVGGNGCL